MADDALDFIFDLLGSDLPKFDGTLRWHERVAIVANFLAGILALFTYGFVESESFEPFAICLFAMGFLVVYHYMIVATARLRSRNHSHASVEVSGDWFWTDPKRVGFWLYPGHICPIILWVVRWAVVPLALYLQIDISATRDPHAEFFMAYAWLLFALLGIAGQLIRILRQLPPKNSLIRQAVP